MQDIGIQRVTVVGAGSMGAGIAHVFAQSGYEVNLVDRDEVILEKALTGISTNLDRLIKKERIQLDDKVNTLMRIKTNTDLAQAVKGSELVVEAVPERLQLKKDIFKSLSSFVSSDCILASNTSSISITQLAQSATHPERVIGMHFMNPVPIMTLVEIIKGYSTSDLVADKIIQVSETLSKTPILVNDYPGFVSNRILMPMINEAICTLQEGVATVEAIDGIMKLGMAHPMGPLELADHIGLDVCLNILEVLDSQLPAPKYAPSALLRNMVYAQKLGKKTYEGFYTYDERRKKNGVASAFNS